jgi:hypothetical protein
MAKFFSINVQGAPQLTAQEGFLNKTTGTPDEAKTTPIKLDVGEIAIPNFSRVWAYQHKKDGVPTGELTFLKWGEDKSSKEKGAVVAIRYLPSCNSLDRQYQDQVAKIVPQLEDSSIKLKTGINDFDEVNDRMLIEMLKHHTCNGNNKSRDPENRNIIFEEYNPTALNTAAINRMKLETKMRELVINAENDEDRLAVLADIFEIDARSQKEIIFEQLVNEVKNLDHFIRMIEAPKQHLALIVDELVKQDAVVFSDEGDVILTIDGKKDFLLRGVESKNPSEWLKENILEPEVFKAYKKLTEISGELMNVYQ